METITPNTKDIERAIRTILAYIGEDPEREGLVGTPDRIIRMYKEIFRGYDKNQKPKITTFKNDMHSTDIVFDSGDYYSMCEHHMMPFFGKYYFAYIPKEDGRILGISKIARVMGYCAARLQLQERLARNVVEMLTDALDGYVDGMAIVMRGTHMCKSMRGVKNQGMMTVAHLSGIFKEDEKARREFYKLIDMQ
jgi:GTP cyclohydrolase I